MKFYFNYGYQLCMFGVAGEAPELFISLHLILHLRVLTLGYKFRAHFDGL